MYPVLITDPVDLEYSALPTLHTAEGRPAAAPVQAGYTARRFDELILGVAQGGTLRGLLPAPVAFAKLLPSEANVR